LGLEHGISKGADMSTDTISAKTDTIILRNPRNDLRLAGIGMYLARKKQHLAPFGRAIPSRIGQ
jgi:hypothetical protein